MNSACRVGQQSSEADREASIMHDGQLSLYCDDSRPTPSGSATSSQKWRRKLTIALHQQGEWEEPVSGHVPTSSLFLHRLSGGKGDSTSLRKGQCQLSLQETEKQETKKQETKLLHGILAFQPD